MEGGGSSFARRGRSSMRTIGQKKGKVSYADDSESESDPDDRFWIEGEEAVQAHNAALAAAAAGAENEDVIEVILDSRPDASMVAAAARAGLEGDDLKAQISKAPLQFLIKWRGWAHMHDSWHTEADLRSVTRPRPVKGLKKVDNYRALLRQANEAAQVMSKEDQELRAIQEDVRCGCFVLLFFRSGFVSPFSRGR